MKDVKDKKQIAKISIFVASVFIIFISLSYAFINLTLAGTKRQVITAGTLALELLEDENNLTIKNALPIYDDVGMVQDPFTFRLINNGTSSANYKVKLVEIGTGTLNKSDVKYALTKDGENTIGLLSDIDSDGVIDSGVIGKSPETIEYELRLWIKDTVTDNAAIEGKSLSYRVDVEVGQEVETNTAKIASEIVGKNLGNSCTTYNDGVDTFLVGQCANNYVWYSGKLWRVVLKNNETGAVKMITENGIATMNYNKSSSAEFENSYMDQWLNQEFLPTLHDYEDYLVTNYAWNATSTIEYPTARPEETTTVTRTVGLLNNYEYSTIYNKSKDSDATSAEYLQNGIDYWLMTSDDVFNDVFYAYMKGGIYSDSPNYGHSARPVVNLKSEIEIDSGSGSLSDPYILKGDVQETIGGTTLLSTRYSGEYVTFNNELYRIVAVEEGLTKITAVDKPASLVASKFHTDTTLSNFAQASIKTELETYYQSLDSVWKEMIQPNTTWYLGRVADTNSYKSTICATEDTNISTLDCIKTTDPEKLATASIALPRLGEMFTSQITRGERDRFWTLTGFTPTSVRSIGSDGDTSGNHPTYTYGARPSMYLKADVKIASNNTGNGTYEKPYSITLDGFSINNVASYSNNQTVTLALSAENATEMCISNTEECTSYEPYATSKTWTLTPGDGEKKIYVYYKDNSGNIIPTTPQTIILDETAPSNNSIQISSEDKLTRTLTISSTGADYMCLSNTSSNASDCTEWVDFENTYSWTLAPNNGSKTVYAFFKDKAGNTSSTSSSVTCNNCIPYTVEEDFSDTTYDKNIQIDIGEPDDYPWQVETSTGKFISTNQNQNSTDSISTITFTPTNDSKLSLDWQVYSETGADRFYITLTGSDGSSVNLVGGQSGSPKSGSIKDQPLKDGVTYTLILNYKKNMVGSNYKDTAYIDNLHIGL